MYIKSLHLRGFKSFNRKTDIHFCPNMNVILGPNGSGKSNIGDAICFVLGRTSSKDLRAENFSDLLFKRKDTVASEGEVSIVLDNSDKIFPFEEKEVEIKRKIKKTGQTVYKINGKTATRQEVLELLALARVFPDGHNIILQGDIARFVDLKPIERRQIIEEIAGIAAYEEKKTRALSELSKVDERLREVHIVLREKESYMKNLDEEKKGAERYKELQNELKAAQSGELALRLKNAKAKHTECTKAIETKLIDINNVKLDIEIQTKKVIQLKTQLENLEAEIQKKGGEESLALQKEVERLKVESANARALLSTSIRELDRILQRQRDLEQNLTSIEQKISRTEAERKDTLKKLEGLKSELEKLKEPTDISKSLKELESSLTAIEKDLESLQKEKNASFESSTQLKAKRQTIEAELSQLNQKKSFLKSSTKEIEQIKKRLDELGKSLESKTKEQTSLAIQIGELKKKIIQKEEFLARTKAQTVAVQELIHKDNVIRFLKERKIKGLIGTVAELGKSPKEYSVALSVAGGNRLKNIVVEDSETAIKCLELLKQNKVGVATFLPINELVSPKIEIPKTILNKEGVFGLASELIECEPKYRKLFSYIFRDTLIIKNIDTARNVGLGKHRLVSLDGDLFETSGAITGGYRSSTPQYFEPKENLKELEQELEELQNQLPALEKKKNTNDADILKLQAERLELEAKLKISIGSDKELQALLKRESELSEELKKLSSEIDRLEKNFSDVSKKIEQLQSQRQEILRKLQTRDTSSTERIEQLSKQISELEAKLAALSATLENALLPEKANILRVLKELEKEKKSFDSQKDELEKKISLLNSELEKKEAEQEEFHGKLKQAFEEQANLSNLLRETQASLDAAKLKLTSLEQEKNNLVIEAAQYAAELSSLEEELRAYEGVSPKEFKTLEDAKNKIKDIQAKIENLGPINMRALEVFQDVLKEYNELAVRVAKLQEEKQSILQIIEEVESKKTEAFTKTFIQVNENFSKIYQKINNRYVGELALENVQKPFEGGVVVELKDAKKKRVSPTALSGGEKVLVALAFIFAIQEFEPAPFYLLDEVEAALDKLNSEQVAHLLKEYSKKAQIIVISHNDATISEGNVLYGVSMTKEGESTVVGLKL